MSLEGNPGQPVRLHQPDSLKLASQLEFLKLLHRVAGEIEDRYGDKSSDKTCFLSGVQGLVSRPAWSRDYTYFLARVQQVRDHLTQSVVRSALAELAQLALDIYNRFENRRRMGVEVMVMAMLLNGQSERWELPDKYHSRMFVMDMLVSCRHRFQKPDKCYFWSRQTQSLLTFAFGQTSRCLTRLKLAIANDQLLRALAVSCRQLKELDLQFSLDVSEEGLLALAGKSVLRKDQGNSRPWSHAYCLNKDFGSPKEWFVKDSLLFTPPAKGGPAHPAVSAASASSEQLPRVFDTGFGCLGLVSLRFGGDFVFPPLLERLREEAKAPSSAAHAPSGGPVLQHSLYILLDALPRLQRVSMNGLPLIISRMERCLGRPARLPLQLLRMQRNLLRMNELESLARACTNLAELVDVSPHCVPEDKHQQYDVYGFPRIIFAGQNEFPEDVCRFLRCLPPSLRSFHGRVNLHCLLGFLQVQGRCLTRLRLHTTVIRASDLLLLRQYAPNLESIEGNFSLREPLHFDDQPLPVLNSPDAVGRRAHHQRHLRQFEPDSPEDKLAMLTGHFSQELLDLTKRYPMPKLTRIDLEGVLSIQVMQLLVGNVESLEELHLSNISANPDVKALSDEWLEALVHANRLLNLKKLTLRMDSEQPVEMGAFSERGLVNFLDHCVEHSPKLTELVGEFTRIPDRVLQQKTEAYAKKGLRRLSIRNAVPYRKFENAYDTERYYSMNQGYHLMLQEQMQQAQLVHQAQLGFQGGGNQHQHHQHQHQQQQQPEQPGGRRATAAKPSRRFSGYIFRPFEKPRDNAEDL